MDYPENLNALGQWSVKHSHFFETRDTKDSQRLKLWNWDARTPANSRLDGK